MQRFTELKVWQKSHALVLEVYRCTKGFPREERFELVSQLRRAAVSVPSNIAEGSKRAHATDYAHFLNVAQASLAESEYLIILSRDLGYMASELATSLFAAVAEIARMLTGLRSAVKNSTTQPAP
jgi:four helix bundle protein